MDIPSDSSFYIKVPPFNYSRILRNAKRAVSVIVDDAEASCDRLIKEFKLSGYHQKVAVRTSISGFDVVDKSRRRLTAYRIAANLPLLRNEVSCPFDPVNFSYAGTYLRPDSRRINEGDIYVYSVFILNGPLAGRSFELSLSKSKLLRTFRVVHGGVRNLHLQGSRELIRLRLPVLLSWDGIRPEAERLGLTSAARKFNLDLTRSRRREHSSCPVGKEVDCVRCKVLWKECPMSVR